MAQEVHSDRGLFALVSQRLRGAVGGLADLVFDVLHCELPATVSASFTWALLLMWCFGARGWAPPAK